MRAALIVILSASALAGASALTRAPARDNAGPELLRIRDSDIVFYERRVAADRQGAGQCLRLEAVAKAGLVSRFSCHGCSSGDC